MRFVFLGTASFAISVLQVLLEKRMVPLAIVTREDKPKRRSGKPSPPPLKEWVLEHAPTIPIHQPKKASDPAFIEQLKEYNADLFVVVAYGEILSESFLTTPRLLCLNVHGSLLPLYRGAAPIQRALLNGDKKTGVSIVKMVKKLDAGAVLHQETLAIGENDTAGNIMERLGTLGGKALLTVFKEQVEKEQFHFAKQDDQLATYAHKISPQEAKIDWNKSAEEVHNHIRAFSPSPGAWCEVSIKGQSQRLKIFSSSCHSHLPLSAPGHFLGLVEGHYLVSCQRGAIAIDSLQIAGKRVMEARNFFNGIDEKQFVLD